MADKLRDSPFFGERVINFTASILSGRTRPDPITDFEKKLLNREQTVKDLNEELDGNLVSLLREAKDYIMPPTALRVLLYFKGLGRLNDGHKIVHYAARDELMLTEEQITELISELRKDPNASVELWLAVLADDAEKEEPVAKGSQLNLPTDFR